MVSFWQYLTVQIVLTERKISLITSLNPSIVKNNGKEGLKRSKVRREEWLALIFRKDLPERKLERTKMKKNAFYLPFIGFFTQSSKYQV